MKSLLAIVVSLFLFGQAPLPLPVEKPTVAVIGSGVGALTSALYLSRGGITPIVIEGKTPGGALTQSHSVQNWPGELDIEGGALTEKIRSQVQASGVQFLSEEVVSVDFSKRPFQIQLHTLDGSDQTHTLWVDACIFAVGTTPNFLHIPGETGSDGYWGKGVSNCAYCDGSLYRGKTIGIVGGGDAAVTEGLYLSRIASQVHLFVRKENFKAKETKRLESLLALPNVHVHYNTTVQEIQGDGEKLNSVILQTHGKSQKQFPLDGLFLAIGSKPNTAFLEKALKLDADGYVVVDRHLQTSVKGVYAIGDMADPFYKQAISAAGDGSKAALHLQNSLQEGATIAGVSVKKPLSAAYGKTHVIEIQSVEQFYQELQGDTPVIIDFYAPWCGPCRYLSPIFEHSAILMAGRVKFLKVNVDRFQDLSRGFHIQSLPSLVIFDPTTQKETARHIGVDPISSYLKRLVG